MLECRGPAHEIFKEIDALTASGIVEMTIHQLEGFSHPPSRYSELNVGMIQQQLAGSYLAALKSVFHQI